MSAFEAEKMVGERFRMVSHSGGRAEKLLQRVGGAGGLL